MKSVYRALLRIYPRDHRALFGGEIERALAMASEVGGTSALRECAGLMKGALAEWIAKLTTDSAIRGRALPDRMMMRPPGVSWEAHYAGAFPAEVMEAERHTELLVGRIVQAIANHRFEDARRYSYEEEKSRENLRLLRQKQNIACSSDT